MESAIDGLIIRDCTLKISVSTIRENLAVHLERYQLCSSNSDAMAVEGGSVLQKDSVYEPGLGDAISSFSAPIQEGYDVFGYNSISQRNPDISAAQRSRLSRTASEVV